MTSKTASAEIRALIQAQIVLPDYLADPLVQRRLGALLAEFCAARVKSLQASSILAI
jgi:hypothetical protein